MNMKKTNQPNNSPEFDRDRGFLVILERLHTDVRIIADGQINLTKKVDILYEEFGRQRERLFVIETDIRFIKNDLSDIKKTLSNHDIRLSRLE